MRDYKDYYAKDRAVWRKWLEKNHAKCQGIWLIYFKKGSGKTRVPYAEAVEEALCFGWIDSRPQAIDELRYKQLFSPRKPGSEWSALNKKRVENLTRQGLMQEAGLKKVAQAKRDGTWSYLDSVESLEMPEDLTAALNKNKKARKNFEVFSRSSKKIILGWIFRAKQATTRKQRISETVKLAARNTKANHYRQ